MHLNSPTVRVVRTTEKVFTTKGISNPVTFLVHKMPGWHFVDHMMPVYLALPEEKRGPFVVHRDLVGAVEKYGIKPFPYNGLLPGNGPVLVCNGSNLRRVLKAHRPVVHIAHGCGLTYTEGKDIPLKFSLSEGGLYANLILTPSIQLRDRYQRAYPQARVVAVGSPKMDRWHIAPHKPMPENYTVCIATHFNRKSSQEATSTLPHFVPALPALKKHFKDRVIGHAHPIIWRKAENVFLEHGIEPVENFEDVLERADVFCTDSSSTLYEFASLDRPVVALNAPWYRRYINHGLRFWEHIPGIQCDGPKTLIDCIELAAMDPPALRKARHDAIRYTYLAVDGAAGARAAKAIMGWQEENCAD